MQQCTTQALGRNLCIPLLAVALVFGCEDKEFARAQEPQAPYYPQPSHGGQPVYPGVDFTCDLDGGISTIESCQNAIALNKKYEMGIAAALRDPVNPLSPKTFKRMREVFEYQISQYTKILRILKRKESAPPHSSPKKSSYLPTTQGLTVTLPTTWAGAEGTASALSRSNSTEGFSSASATPQVPTKAVP